MEVVALICDNVCKTKREVFVFIIVKPQPALEPLRLTRMLHHPKFTLGEGERLRLVQLLPTAGVWMEPELISRLTNLLNLHQLFYTYMYCGLAGYIERSKVRR